MRRVPPLAQRVLVLQLLPAVVVCALTGWAAVDSARCVARLIRHPQED